jgi:hypothetical protein
MLISLIFLFLGIIFLALWLRRMSNLNKLGFPDSEIRDDGLSLVYFTIGCLTFFPSIPAIIDKIPKN